MVLLVGLLIATLGPVFSPLLPRLYPRYEGVTALFAGFCVYTVFLAANGVAEAFSTAAADSRRLKAASLHLLLSAALQYALTLPLLPYWGISAVIATNALVAALRTLSSLSYTSILLSRELMDFWPYLLSALPRTLTLGLLGAAMALGERWMRVSRNLNFLTTLTGVGVVGLATAAGVFCLEAKRLRETWKLLKGSG